MKVLGRVVLAHLCRQVITNQTHYSLFIVLGPKEINKLIKKGWFCAGVCSGAPGPDCSMIMVWLWSLLQHKKAQEVIPATRNNHTKWQPMKKKIQQLYNFPLGCISFFVVVFFFILKVSIYLKSSNRLLKDRKEKSHPGISKGFKPTVSNNLLSH